MTDTTPSRTGYLDVEELKKRVRGYGVVAQEVVDIVRNVANPLERYFPFQTTDREEIEFWTREGNAGLMGVARGANIPATKAQFRRHYEITKVDKFAYGYTYEVLERSTDDFTLKDAQDAAMWFGAARQFKQITALKAGAGKSVSAGAYWTDSDPSEKIYECLDHLNDYGWQNGALGPALVMFPARVGRGIYSSQYVNGSYTQRYRDIAGNYNNSVIFIPITPFRTANDTRQMDVMAETESDVIGNDAIITIGNPTMILRSKEYNFQRTPNVFTDAVKDWGVTTVLHRQTGCKIVPQGNADDADDSDLLSDASTTKLICKITGVAASR